MKTCVDCGAELTEGEPFCRGRGAAGEKSAVPEAEEASSSAGLAAPKAGPSRRRAGIPAAVAGAAVLLLGDGLVVRSVSSPARQFVTYQQTFLKKGLLSALEKSMEAYNSDEKATVVGPDGQPASISPRELEKLASDLQEHLQYAVMGALF